MFDLTNPLFIIFTIAFAGWQLTRFAFPAEPSSAGGSGIGEALGAMFEGARQAAIFAGWLIVALVAALVYALFFRGAA